MILIMPLLLLSKNDASESNLATDDDAPAFLALLYPKTGGLAFFDDLWMVDIQGVDQYLDLHQ